MSSLALHRHHIILQPESARVIIRPFIPSSARRLATVIGQIDKRVEHLEQKIGA